MDNDPVTPHPPTSSSFFADGDLDLSGIGKSRQRSSSQAQVPLGSDTFVSKTQTPNYTVEGQAGSSTVPAEPKPKTESQYLQDIATFVQEDKPAPVRWKRLGIAGGAVAILIGVAYLIAMLYFQGLASAQRADLHERKAEFYEKTGYDPDTNSAYREDYIPSRVHDHDPVQLDKKIAGTTQSGTLDVYPLNIEEGQQYTILLRDVSENGNTRPNLFLYTFDEDDNRQHSFNGMFSEPDDKDEDMTRQKSTSIGELDGRDIKLSFVAEQTGTVALHIGTLPANTTTEYLLIVE